MIIKKIINRIVRSSGSPDKNDLWLDDNLNLKVHENEKWKTIAGGSGGGSSSASSLSDMTDVDISSPSDGDTLVYNATTHKWENGSGSGCSCLPPMIVEGTIDENSGVFTPSEGAPTWSEAHDHMFQGGLLYLLILDDGEPFVVILVTVCSPYALEYDNLSWPNPDSGGSDDPEGGDDYEPQTYTVQGTVNSLSEFTESVGQMSYTEAKQHYNNGDTIILHFTVPATGVVQNQTVVSWTNESGATTTNGFTWFALV